MMKDMYSFDATQEMAFVSYEQVKQAYQNIFNRLEINYAIAEADSGNIGGNKSQEFHALCNAGEDVLLSCTVSH